MAQNLSTLTITDPTVDPNIAESGTFTFEVTPTFNGGGGINSYDLDFQYDQGTGSWTTIPASSGGLTTSNTNPITGLAVNTPSSITVTGVTTDTYSIRVVGTGGSNPTSNEQTVTVGGGGANPYPSVVVHYYTKLSGGNF